MNNRNKKNIRDIYVYIVAVLLFLIITFMTYQFVTGVMNGLWDNSIEDIMESTSKAANIVNARLNGELNVIKRHRMLLEKSKSSDIDYINFLKEEFYYEDSTELLIIDKKIYNSKGNITLADIPDLPLDEIGIIDPYVSRITKKKVIALYTNFKFVDNKEGILIKEVDLDKISEEFSVSFYKTRGFSHIVNEEGAFISKSSKNFENDTSNNIFDILQTAPNNNESQLAIFRNDLRSKAEGHFLFKYKNTKYALAYVPVKDTSWCMVAIIERSILNEWIKYIIDDTFRLMFSIAFGIIFILCWWILNKKIANKNTELENILERRMIIEAVSKVNSTIIGINLLNEKFKIILDYNDLQIKYQDYRNYSEMINACTQLVSDEFREEFATKFNINNLRENLNSECKSISLEFIANIYGSRHWMAVEVIYIDTYDDNKNAIYTAKIIDDVKAEEEKNREILNTALSVANQASNAKTTFLNRMSHDIRTPLNGIIGMTEIARANIDDRQKVKNSLGKIVHASNHLMSLINEILDMSQIESGRVDLDNSSFNLSMHFDEMIDMIMPQALAKKQKVVIKEKHICNENVIGDVTRLKQVFVNIVGNAVKYTPCEGMITLSLTENELKEENYSEYKLVCQDNGYGMKEEFLDKIFEPFERAQEAHMENISGTGLGMVIVKNLVSLMGGNISVESEYGVGSKFTVIFKLKIDKNNKSDISKEKEEIYFNDDIAAFKNIDFSGKRVLLADDNKLNCDIIEEIFSMTGVSLKVVNNGKDALEIFSDNEEHYFDMIFMDIQMPIMNGYEATANIRKLERTDAKKIPIVAMSANAFANDMETSKKYGMNDYISKPIKFIKLLEVMKRYLGGIEKEVVSIEDKIQYIPAKFEEEIYFANGSEVVSKDNERVFTEVLEKNNAVGIFGVLELKDYPIYCVSYFSLMSLGYTYSELLEKTEGKFINLIYPEDRNKLETEFYENNSRLNYRMVAKNGRILNAIAYSTDTWLEDGSKIRIMSVRVEGRR